MKRQQKTPRRSTNRRAKPPKRRPLRFVEMVRIVATGELPGLRADHRQAPRRKKIRLSQIIKWFGG